MVCVNMECGEYNNIRQDNLSQHFKIMVNISYETGRHLDQHKDPTCHAC